MDWSPLTYLALFLSLAIGGWLLLNSAVLLICCGLGVATNSKIRVRAVGRGKLKDVSLVFEKGPIALVRLALIHVSLWTSESPVSRTCSGRRFHINFSDVQVVLKGAGQNAKRGSKRKKAKSKPGSLTSSWGLCRLLVAAARSLHVSLADLTISSEQLPNLSLHVRDVDLASSHGGKGSLSLGWRLESSPWQVLQWTTAQERPRRRSFLWGRPRPEGEHSSIFLLDHFIIDLALNYKRDVGLAIQKVAVDCGDAVLTLTERLGQLELVKPAKSQIESTLQRADAAASEALPPPVEGPVAEGKEGQASAEIKSFPEEIRFVLPSVKVACSNSQLADKLESQLLRLEVLATAVEGADSAAARMDVKLECHEMEVLRVNHQTLFELPKLAVQANMELPSQDSKEAGQLQAAVDVELGGPRFAFSPSFEPWLALLLASVRKTNDADPYKTLENTEISDMEEVDPIAESHLAADADSDVKKDSDVNKKRGILERLALDLSLSAPEFAVVAYGVEGVPLYRLFLQTASMWVGLANKEVVEATANLAGLWAGMAETGVECPDVISSCRESRGSSSAAADPQDRSLLHLARANFSYGLNAASDEPEPDRDDCSDHSAAEKLTANIDLCGGEVFLSLPRVRQMVEHLSAVEAYAKAAVGKRKKRKRKSSRQKKIERFRVTVEGCTLSMLRRIEHVFMEARGPGRGAGRADIAVVTPTRRGGEVVEGVLSQSVMCSGVVTLGRVVVVGVPGEGYTRLTSERCHLDYYEAGEQSYQVSLLSTQRAEGTFHMATSDGLGPRSLLLSACGIDGHWEPDAHLFFFAVAQEVKSLLALRKRGKDNFCSAATGVVEGSSEGSSKPQGSTAELASAAESAAEKSGLQKAPLSISLDLELLNFDANLAEEWVGVCKVQSVFSEDVRIGVLVERLEAGLNEKEVLSAESLQISRLPPSPAARTSRGAESEGCEPLWDVLVQARGIKLRMPYRLEFQVAEDATEDTWRGLKYVMLAMQGGSAPAKKVVAAAKKEKKGVGIGAVRLSLEDIVAEIEDEPFQGWLDAHMRALGKEVREADVRLAILQKQWAERLTRSKSLGARSESSKVDRVARTASLGEGEDAAGSGDENSADVSSLERLEAAREEIYRQAFRAYAVACEKLSVEAKEGVGPGGRGTVRVGKTRQSLLSLRAASLDVTLRAIEGGVEGMHRRARELDSVKTAKDVPFVRAYGANMDLSGAGLRLQLRDYPLPLLAAASARAAGDVIFAQQATVVLPQIWQELRVGHWCRVSMLRSARGCSTPYKMYSGLDIEMDGSEAAYSVGFEPAFADLSYAFTVAMRKQYKRPGQEGMDLAAATATMSRRAALGGTDLGLGAPPPERKERSLPWWDDMRYYVHGRNKLILKDFEWSWMSTTDPYEEEQQLQLAAGVFEVRKTPGKVVIDAQRMRLSASSGGLDVTGTARGSNVGSDMGGMEGELMSVRPPLIESPDFVVEFILGWECQLCEPLMHYLHAMPWEPGLRAELYNPFRSSALKLGIHINFKSSAAKRRVSSTEGGRPRRTTEWPEQECVSPSRFSRSRSEAGWAKSSPFDEEDTPEEEEADISDTSDNSILSLGAPDLLFIFAWWSLVYYPPMKLRTFSRWPRFSIPRWKRSGNLGLDRVLTDIMLRVESVPLRVQHVSVGGEDPAEGLTFQAQSLKYEVVWYRPPLDPTHPDYGDPNSAWAIAGERPKGFLQIVFQALDIQLLRVFLAPEEDDAEVAESDVAANVRKFDKLKQLMELPDFADGGLGSPPTVKEGEPAESPTARMLFTKQSDQGFLLSTDSITLRKQSPAADPRRLATWRLGTQRQPPTATWTGLNSDSEAGSGNSGISDGGASEDETRLALVLADSCLRVSVHGLKLLWTLPNRDAVWAWVGDISRSFETTKPSPSKAYAQRKRLEEQQRLARWMQMVKEKESVEVPKSPGLDSEPCSGGTENEKGGRLSSSDKEKGTPPKHGGRAGVPVVETIAPPGENEEGDMKFMVNIIQPQFNLHSDAARGRFLLAAASGRVLARSFHTALFVGLDAMNGGVDVAEVPGGGITSINWKRRELSILLEHVQAHVAPTDVDLGAGIQWLPKVPRDGRPRVKRAGSLLQRVFTPCTMVFQYTRHKGGQESSKEGGPRKGGTVSEGKVKPLKHMQFNSPEISAAMTSRQFSILLDVISNLLLARLPRSRKYPLRWGVAAEEEWGDFELEEEADEVVPEGVEEVELARIALEARDRECKGLAQAVRALRSRAGEAGGQTKWERGASTGTDEALWMVTANRAKLVYALEQELKRGRGARMGAREELRAALASAAKRYQQQSKHPSSAMRISWMIDKASWSMLCDGDPFAEAEINNMVLNVDRDFDDVGVARFTAKSFSIKNCLPHPRCKLVLAPWNAPAEWGKMTMLRVDAKQGAPVNGVSPILHFEVHIHPLQIFLTENMYNMMWEYFFPKDELRPEQRQEAWRAPNPAANTCSKRHRRATTNEGAPRGAAVSEPAVLRTSELEGLLLSPKSFASGWSWMAPPAAQPDPPPSSGMTTPGRNAPPRHTRTASGSLISRRSSSGEYTAGELSTGTDVGFSGPLMVSSAEGGAVIGRRSMTRRGSRGRQESFVMPQYPTLGVTVAPVGDKDEEGAQAPLQIRFIRINQVELLVTYEGAPFSFNEWRYLCDTFTRESFAGSWRRLFFKVKKHIIWGVLKSVAGVQGKKFHDQLPTASAAIAEGLYDPDSDSAGNSSESAGPSLQVQPGSLAVEAISLGRFSKSNRSTEGFVSSIKGLFNAQRRKAKAIMRESAVARKSPIDRMGPLDEDAPSSSDVDSDGGEAQGSLTKRLMMRRSQARKLRSATKLKGAPFSERLKSGLGGEMQESGTLPPGVDSDF